MKKITILTIPFLFINILCFFCLTTAYGNHTATPVNVSIPGNLQDELGCSSDWQPECAVTQLTYDSEDDVWQNSFSLSAGNWEYKATINDSWDENYGANSTQNGANIPLELVDPADIKFYYDHKSHWITDNHNAVIANVSGDFQQNLGCTGNWDPSCLRSWLQDPEGDGIYSFTTSDIPAGEYEAKVTHNEAWDISYPDSNIQFTIPAGCSNVSFIYDPIDHDLNITCEIISVTIAGSFQEELGCSLDWQPECAVTHLVYDFEDDVWQGSYNIPAGNWEYKATINDSWEENYGANSTRDGPNIPLEPVDPADIKFYYDHKSHWITDNHNAVIATVSGDFQQNLGCTGNWDPSCLRSWLQDPEGDGIYSFTTPDIPAGDYEAKVTHNESWDISYPDSNIQFTVPAGCSNASFIYDPIDHVLSISFEGCEPDSDGDTIPDSVDNCPETPNPDQTDSDSDGAGNECDPCPFDSDDDIDGDGLCEQADNCPEIANPDQEDFDEDGEGDICDDDVDGDGVPNDDEDVDCRFTPVGEIVDLDGCGVEQLVPCDGPKGTTETWKNHGKYMAEISKILKEFFKEGLITADEKSALQEELSLSDCGK